MTRALTPLDSICSAMDFIVFGLPLAFLTSQLRLYCLQAAASALGSAVTQRGDEMVSGRMMPTFAPLPSTAPPVEEDDDADEAGVVAGWVAGGALVLPLPPLELQAASANAATTPI